MSSYIVYPPVAATTTTASLFLPQVTTYTPAQSPPYTSLLLPTQPISYFSPAPLAPPPGPPAPPAPPAPPPAPTTIYFGAAVQPPPPPPPAPTTMMVVGVGMTPWVCAVQQTPPPPPPPPPAPAAPVWVVGGLPLRLAP